MSSHAYHRLYYHFVWTLKEREPLLTGLYADFLTDVVRKACRDRKVEPLALYVMPEHVHLFVRLMPSMAPATFVGQIKGVSARSFNETFCNRLFIKWQDGYGAVTVREAERDKVIYYVENQPTIHANRKASRFMESVEEPLEVAFE